MMPRPCRFTTQIPMIDKQDEQADRVPPTDRAGDPYRDADLDDRDGDQEGQEHPTTLSAGHRSYARRRARPTTASQRLRRSTRWLARSPTSRCRSRCSSTPLAPRVAADDPDSASARAEATAHALLQPVINATGVLLHTNLGRAPVAWQQDAGLLEPRARPRLRPSRLAPRARSARSSPGVRRRGRDGREQRRVGRAPRARRAWRVGATSSSRAAKRSRSAEGSGCPRSWRESGARLVDVGHDEPHPPRRLLERARSRRHRRGARAEGAPVELPHRGVHRGRRGRPSWRRSMCRSSSTSARGCSTPRARG